MCLISTEINKVSNTKIFCAASNDKNRQLIIYSNEIDNISNGNAMILPVPLPQTLKFHDLSNYKNFFDDCEACFYKPTKSLSFSANSIDRAENLPIFKVGSYLVSVAQNLDQLNQVNGKVFILSDGLKKVLSMYYYQPYWGFIICKLGPGNNNYHPFGYSHQIIQNKIYVPTRHYHEKPDINDVNNWGLGLRLGLDGSNPISSSKWDESNIDKSPMFSQNLAPSTTAESFGWIKDNSSGLKPNFVAKINPVKTMKQSSDQKQSSNQFIESEIDDWSHDIYFYNINPYINQALKTMNSSKYEWDNKSIPELRKIDFPFGKPISFEKIKITGTHPNIDIVF